MSQGAASPRTQDIKHRANHSDAALVLRIHTHEQRATQSNAILLERIREPNSVIGNYDTS